MNVKVSGKGMDVGAALKSYIEEEVTKVVNKYFERSIDTNIVLGKQAHLFYTNIHILIGTGTGIVIKGEANATNAYVSFDEALEKVSKQLRRYKKRLQNHHAATTADRADTINAREYVFTPEHEEESASIEDNPVVIAESNRSIETMKVRTAVMRMDLENAPLYIFRNEASGHLNVIYKREDGNIGWVDTDMCEPVKAAPKQEEAAA